MTNNVIKRRARKAKMRCYVSCCPHSTVSGRGNECMRGGKGIGAVLRHLLGNTGHSQPVGGNSGSPAGIERT